ncbi:hypothetical protein GCM10010270_26810 [Streptomyces violaceus]|nr:hypothetical protein GCM10010270_26810 [Streptomyces janthinus]
MGRLPRCLAALRAEVAERSWICAGGAEEAGVILVRLALAFVLEHPAITSTIAGPRTFEQLDSQLGADKIRVSRDVLDRVDEIVPPGTALSPRDAGHTPPSLTDPAWRRRSQNGAAGRAGSA